MKGQLSAEMLILIAVIIAVVAIAATRLIGTAKDTSTTIDKESDTMLKTAQSAMKGEDGDPCEIPDNCKSDKCGSNKRCVGP